MSTNVPFSFSNISLSPGISGWRNATGTSNVTTFLFSFASIIHVENNASKEMVGDATVSSSFKYCLCRLTLAHVRPLICPDRFFLIKLTASNALDLSDVVHVDAAIGLITGLPGMAPSSSC